MTNRNLDMVRRHSPVAAAVHLKANRVSLVPTRLGYGIVCIYGCKLLDYPHPCFIDAICLPARQRACRPPHHGCPHAALPCPPARPGATITLIRFLDRCLGCHTSRCCDGMSLRASGRWNVGFALVFHPACTWKCGCGKRVMAANTMVKLPLVTALFFVRAAPAHLGGWARSCLSSTMSPGNRTLCSALYTPPLNMPSGSSHG